MPAWAISYLLLPVITAVGIALFLTLRTRLPWLKLVASPVESAALRRAQIAEDELGRANDAISVLTEKVLALEKERSMAAVIDLVVKVAGGVDQTLVKLGELNGGLAHAASALERTNENLKTSTKAIELLASQIIIDVRGREQ